MLLSRLGSSDWMTVAGRLQALALAIGFTDLLLALARGLRLADLPIGFALIGVLSLGTWVVLAVAFASFRKTGHQNVFRASVAMLAACAAFIVWTHHFGIVSGKAREGLLLLFFLAVVAFCGFQIARLSWPILLTLSPLLLAGYVVARHFERRLPSASVVIAIGAACLVVGMIARYAERRHMAIGAVVLSVVTSVSVVGALQFPEGHAFSRTWTMPEPRRALPDQPNIVLVVIDTLRADRLGSYGYRARQTSPALDRFAQSAMVFDAAYSSSSWTVPAVATIFTGKPALAHAVTVYGRSLPPAPTLAELLRARGYTTIGVSANMLVSDVGGFNRGFSSFTLLTRPATMPFDALVILQEHAREYVGFRGLPMLTGKPPASRAVQEMINRLPDRVADRPMFAYLHLLDPHEPCSRRPDRATEGWRAGLSDRPFDTSWSLAYDREVRFADEQLGHLLDALKRTSSQRRTVVIVTADHGEQLGENGKRGHGSNLDEAVIRVPLIVGTLPPSVGGRVSAPVTLEDLHPFILAAGTKPLRTVEAIRTHLLRPDDPSTEYLAVQRGRWKLVRVREKGTIRESLLHLPDEMTNHLAEGEKKGELRAMLPVDSRRSADTYDPEAVRRLRALGYIQ